MTTSNSTIAYAMSDMAPSEDGRLPAGVIRPAGGCGQEHTALINDDGRPYIECPVCAPELIAHHYGYAATPAGVPLTPDELGDVEIAKRQGEHANQLFQKRMAETIAMTVQNTLPARMSKQEEPAPLTAADMFAALGDDELAKFRAMLAAAPAGPETQAAVVPAEKPKPAPRKTTTPAKPRTTRAS